MSHEGQLLVALAVAISACGGSRDRPGGPPVDPAVPRPDAVTAFAPLYAANCAGCHGAEGKGGVSLALADPVYLAIADDATIRRVIRDGVTGTGMPPFGRSAGGMLTDDQVDALVRGIRGWSNPAALRDAEPPPYADRRHGDVNRGVHVYATYCASCHGASGGGGKRASSIVDGSFLALVSDQYLRTIVITGRPELGAPDWRGNVPGTPMSPEDVTDVVSWLAAQRPAVAGQPYPSARAVIGERP
jgi:cytochrome c oxidase cbb3-type subunit III